MPTSQHMGHILHFWWEKGGFAIAKRRKSRSKSGRPKGSYPLPNGDYVVKGRSTPIGSNGRRLVDTAIHRKEPDYKKLAEALIDLAQEQIRANRSKNRKQT
jgi:hypothetical protein